MGSSFKPYVYTAAIDRGASPDDTILDAPVTFPTPSGPPYEPHNYDEKFEGTITLRRALAQSRNIPALKLADSLGIKTVIDYAHRFGITSSIPPYLPVALGAVEITPIEQTSAFSVFPNDGVHVMPRYITKVTDYEGRTLEENFPDVKDVISARTARIMTSMLREVVLHGTAIAAAGLKYPLAGKTGTTNNFTDAWFVGFSPSITCGVWIGYDEKKFLGAKETGARAALPIWMDFMKTALAGKDPGEFQPTPEPLGMSRRIRWTRPTQRPRKKKRISHYRAVWRPGCVGTGLRPVQAERSSAGLSAGNRRRRCNRKGSFDCVIRFASESNPSAQDDMNAEQSTWRQPPSAVEPSEARLFYFCFSAAKLSSRIPLASSTSAFEIFSGGDMRITLP